MAEILHARVQHSYLLMRVKTFPLSVSHNTSVTDERTNKRQQCQ